MSNYQDALAIMTERFSKDSLIAVATTDGSRMHNRMVDAYYQDGAFYVTTNALSGKMQQITVHAEVAVCAVDWFTGHGIATNIGWVMAPENAEIRLKLREAFADWYDIANNENDESCCIMEIGLTDGMLVKDHFAVRYSIDFVNATALLSEHWGEFK